jgi:arginyl-tRNA synthetase
LFEAVEKLGWINKDRLVHVAHGWMRLPEGKMSTRKGNLVKMEELLVEAIKRAVELADGEMEIARKVGVGAVIYNELKHAPETDYVFSFDEAMNMEGDSGPYLQYCVVRGRSVLAKVKNDIDHFLFDIDRFGEEEMEILRYLYRFGEVVEVAAKSFSPNLVCSYLFELASRFNRFYNKEKIIGSEREKERLLLTRAVVQVLENGLLILGMKVPERM